MGISWEWGQEKRGAVESEKHNIGETKHQQSTVRLLEKQSLANPTHFVFVTGLSHR